MSTKQQTTTTTTSSSAATTAKTYPTYLDLPTAAPSTNSSTTTTPPLNDTTTPVSPSTSKIPTYSSISLLPFSIGFSGKVKNLREFFKPTSTSSSSRLIQPRKIGEGSSTSTTTSSLKNASISTTTTSTQDPPQEKFVVDSVKKEEEEEDDDDSIVHQEASFRGRSLISTRFKLPQGYQGWIVEIKEPLPPPPPMAVSTATSRPIANKEVDQSLKDNGGSGRKRKALRPLMKGVRTSPRKKQKKIEKFSLDSDQEEGDGDELMENQIKLEMSKSLNNKEEEEGGGMTESSFSSSITSSTAFTATGLSSTSTTATSLTPSDIESPNSFPVVTSNSLLVNADPDIEKAEIDKTQNARLQEEQEEEAPLARDEIHLRPIAFFKSIDIYNPDSILDEQNDVFVRALKEWTGLAAKLHAY